MVRSRLLQESEFRLARLVTMTSKVCQVLSIQQFLQLLIVGSEEACCLSFPLRGRWLDCSPAANSPLRGDAPRRTSLEPPAPNHSKQQ